MMCPNCTVALAGLIIWAGTASAADLAYVGPRGGTGEQAAELYRSRTPGFDRIAPQDKAEGVVTAVKSGDASSGIVPATSSEGGFAGDLTPVLRGPLDPGFRIVGGIHVEDETRGTIPFWVIAKSIEKLPEQHADHLAVDLEAPAGSKAFSLVVAGLSKLGFSVVGVDPMTMPGKPFGYRYMVVFASDKPLLALRATDQIARDSRAGEGRAVLIGAWQRGS